MHTFFLDPRKQLNLQQLMPMPFIKTEDSSDDGKNFEDDSKQICDEGFGLFNMSYFIFVGNSKLIFFWSSRNYE